jgi:hypothetical protein
MKNQPCNATKRPVMRRKTNKKTSHAVVKASKEIVNPFTASEPKIKADSHEESQTLIL